MSISFSYPSGIGVPCSAWATISGLNSPISGMVSLPLMFRTPWIIQHLLDKRFALFDDLHRLEPVAEFPCQVDGEGEGHTESQIGRVGKHLSGVLVADPAGDHADVRVAFLHTVELERTR